MSVTFLAGMLWKSAAIAAVALFLLKLLRAQAAAERAAVLRVAVVVLLALPLVALAAPALRIAVLPPKPTTPAEAPMPVLATLADDSVVTTTTTTTTIATPSAATDGPTWDNPGPLVAILYAGGALLVGLRLVAGLVTLRRWTRAAVPVECPAWLAAFEDMRAAAPHTRLLETIDIGSPLSWGFRDPVILIDRDRIAHPDDAEAILAHEFAHIVRRDWLMLMLMHVATAIFWFNPLVWLLEREAVQQAEEAADAQALARTDPAHYAQMLLSYAEYALPRMPANCMAPEGGVARRVRAILAHGLNAARPKRRWAWAAMLACIGVAAPISAAKFVAAQMPEAAKPKPSIASPAWAESAGVAETPATPAVAAIPAVAPTPKVAPTPVTPVTALTPVTPVTSATPVVRPVARIAPVARVLPVERVSMNDDDRREMERDIAEAKREALRDAEQARREALQEARQAQQEAERDRQQALRDADQARRDAQHTADEGRREALRATAEAQRAAAEGRRQAAEAQRQAMRATAEGVRQASAASAQVAAAMTLASAEIDRSVNEGLRGGADGMERGAQKLAEEARKLHDPAYRQQQIARAAADGHPVTERQLIDAIPRMEQGAVRMREGAQRMRDGAVHQSNGAARMQAGADRMIDGAQRMRESAANLRRADYRQQRIAEAAARGETVTDEQLRNAIPGLENGARDLEKGAAELRQQATQLAKS